jgi:hypothetical protein
MAINLFCLLPCFIKISLGASLDSRGIPLELDIAVNIGKALLKVVSDAAELFFVTVQAVVVAGVVVDLVVGGSYSAAGLYVDLRRSGDALASRQAWVGCNSGYGRHYKVLGAEIVGVCGLDVSDDEFTLLFSVIETRVEWLLEIEPNPPVMFHVEIHLLDTFALGE